MTPKEKAEDLLEKYNTYIINSYKFHFIITKDEIYLSKKCALIAVDEIINSNPHSNPLNTDVYSTMNWWQQVKQEIEKL